MNLKTLVVLWVMFFSSTSTAQVFDIVLEYEDLGDFNVYGKNHPTTGIRDYAILVLEGLLQGPCTKGVFLHQVDDKLVFATLLNAINAKEKIRVFYDTSATAALLWGDSRYCGITLLQVNKK